MSLPRRPVSTAPNCSTSTRVGSSSISISGRNVAALALCEVGATITTDRGRNSSACRTTPNLRPRCSWPLLRGGRSSWMSPLRTEAFHQGGHFPHLLPIGFIGLQRRDLRGDFLTAPEVVGRLDKSRPDGLGATHSRRFKAGKSAGGFLIKTDGDGSCHVQSVSHFVIQMPKQPRPGGEDIHCDMRANRQPNEGTRAPDSFKRSASSRASCCAYLVAFGIVHVERSPVAQSCSPVTIGLPTRSTHSVSRLGKTHLKEVR